MARGFCQTHYMRFRRANPGAPLLYEYGVSLADKLKRFYAPGKPDECWLWTGKLNHAGYGRVFDEQGAMVLAHRAIWELANGKQIPAGMVAMHTCDRPACVNPNHIRVGTQAENLLDMRQKGRGHDGFAIEPIRGEKHHSSKLTVSDVRKIRRSREPLKVLAERYGVNRASIIKVRSRVTWKHID